MKILLVDDAEDVRSYISTIIENWGYTVETASNARKTLKILQ